MPPPWGEMATVAPVAQLVITGNLTRKIMQKVNLSLPWDDLEIHSSSSVGAARRLEGVREVYQEGGQQRGGDP